MRYNRDSKMPTGDHNFSSFFVQSLSLSLSSSVPLSIGCVLKRSPSISMCIRWLLRIVSFSMHHEIRCSSFSLSAMNPWPDDVFFRPTIWCRYPKRAAHEFADPQYIQFWVTNYGFGIWRKLQSSDRNRNNIHNIQTIQNASNQCLLITIFLFRLLQFNYKSNTNKLVGQT